MKIFAAVVAAYDTVGTAAKTLYFATKGFASTPADTPTHTAFLERLRQPAAMRRDMFASGRTMGASKVSPGDLVLDNSDGALDYLLDYAFDGRAVTVYMADAEGAVFPGGYEVLARATMDVPEFALDSVTLRLRDRQLELEVPLQGTLYDGDNALPAGLEGVEDLKGKPKPLTFGTVRNISPPCVNTAKLIYQVNDGAVESIAAVYDRGIEIRSDSDTPVWSEIACPISDIAAVGEGVAYSPPLDMFLAVTVKVGTKGAIASTDRGRTWVGREVGNANGTFHDVAWGADVFVVVGVTTGGNATISVSQDGIVFATQTTVGGATVFYGVTYAESLGMFIAVGSGGIIYTSDTFGGSWTARASGVATDLRAVAWSDGLTMAVAVGDNDVVLSSPDGVNWTDESPIFGFARVIEDVAVDPVNDRFVIVARSGDFGYSDNGTDWTTDNLGGGSPPSFTAVAYYHGYGFAATAQNIPGGTTSYFYESDDGETWASNTAIAGAFHQNDIAIGGGAIVIVGSVRSLPDESRLYRSPVPTRGYATEADLLDDDLAPGEGWAKAYLAGGYFRLGSPPAGVVTADVTQGAAAADRTAAQGWKWALGAGGMTAADWSAADIAALDVANNAEVGYWSGLDPVTCAAVASLMVGSVGAWWGVDRTGIFRTALFDDPTGEAADVEFVEEQLVKDLERVPTADEGRGIPIWRYVVRYSKNYTPQTEVAAGVTDARRADLALPWREESDEDATVQTAYLLAREQVDESLLVDAVDAAAEATRRLALRKVRRDRFEFVVGLDANSIEVDLGSFVGLTHSRFGLTAGKVFHCISVAPNAVNEQLTLGIWG